jgi:DNA-binding transcriptional LysR family regulator
MGDLRKSTDEMTSLRQRAAWDDLRVFFYVIETGSFSAAAAALGLTPSTVSRRMDDLEVRLSAQLLVRTPAGVHPTEAGEAILDHVRTMERSAGAIERLVVGHDRKGEGRVGIFAPDGIGAFILMPELAAFHRENPKITLALDCGLWADSPLKGQIDLSLQFDEDKQPDIVSETLATIHYCLFASRSYLDTYGWPRTLADVATARFVHHSAQKRQPETWNSKTAALLAMADPSLQTNSSAAMLMAIQGGAGIGPMATAAVLFCPDLVALDFPPVASPKLWVRYHCDLARTARVKRVLDWLKSVFDPKTKPWFRPEYLHPSTFEEETKRQRANWGLEPRYDLLRAV